MKVVIVIPAGTFPDIEILLNNLNRQQTDFDECEVWMNCLSHDLERLRNLVANYKFARCVYPKWPERSIDGIGRFINECKNKETLYIRLDNDICYIANNAIKNLVTFKLSHPECFLTYANCVNNDITSHFYQTKGLVPAAFGHFDCRYGNSSRHDPLWMMYLHDMFIKDCRESNTNKYEIADIIYHSANYICPVNAVSWFGEDFDKYGDVHGNEEFYLATRNATNSICGSSIVCHFKYQSQIKHLGKSGWQKYNAMQKEYLELSR